MSLEEKNSFKKLEEEQIKEYFEDNPDIEPRIEMGVTNNVRLFGFVGNILELYLPRVLDLFISLVGGKKDDEQPPGAGTKQNNTDEKSD